jgi:hypothetical protein
MDGLTYGRFIMYGVGLTLFSGFLGYVISAVCRVFIKIINGR